MVIPLIIAGAALVLFATSCNNNEKDKKREEFKEALKKKNETPPIQPVTRETYSDAPFLLKDYDGNGKLDANDWLDNQKSTTGNMVMRYPAGNAAQIAKYYVEKVYTEGAKEKIMFLGEIHYTGSDVIKREIAREFSRKGIPTTFAFEHDKSAFANLEQQLNQIKPSDVAKNKTQLEQSYLQALAKSRGETNIAALTRAYNSSDPRWGEYRKNIALILDIRAMGHTIAFVDSKSNLNHLSATDPQRLQLRDDGITQNLSQIRAEMDKSEKRKAGPLIFMGGSAHTSYTAVPNASSYPAALQTRTKYNPNEVSSHMLIPSLDDHLQQMGKFNNSILPEAKEHAQTLLALLQDWMPPSGAGENPKSHDGFIAYQWK